MSTLLTFNKYQEGLENGKLLGVTCNSCKTVTTPPMAVCRECGNRDLTVSELEKSGTILTFTVIRVASEGLAPPFIVALVKTVDGACVLGNLNGIDPDAADMDLIDKEVNITSDGVKGDKYAIGDMHTLMFNLA